MPTDAALSLVSTHQHAHASPQRLHTILWLALGIVFLATVGHPAVRRTQEARVLETAREMLGSGPRGWLIPHVNGQVRLNKPPLAYWFAAASYKLFGVGEQSGRMPFAIAGWLTVAMTFRAAKWLFNTRAGWFAAAALATSYLFFRHMQLAETDALATLFVTVATYLMWKASSPGSSRASIIYFHLGSAAIALAGLSKGPPALFPVLFLIALAGFSRRWDILWRWVASGAPLTLLLISIPWVAYALTRPEASIFAKELDVVVAGRDHNRWFFEYFYLILPCTAPWTLFMVFALIRAIRLWKINCRTRGLLLWCASIFIPLCLAGNKQVHYLLPLLPPLMILVGWLIDEALRAALTDGVSVQLLRSFQTALMMTVLAAIAAIVAPRHMVYYTRPIDIVVCIALVVLTATVFYLQLRAGLQLAIGTFAIGCAALWPVIVGFWMPSLNLTDTRTLATEFKSRFGDARYMFLGENVYLPLCFALQEEMPVAGSAQQLPADPNLVVLVQIDEHNKQPPPAPHFPTGFDKEHDIGARDQRFEVYRFHAHKELLEQH